MKRNRITKFALALMAVGIIGISCVCASPPAPAGGPVWIWLDFTNAAQVCYVTGPALPTSGVAGMEYGYVMTDGSGKIDGVATVIVSFKNEDNDSRVIGIGHFLTDITGSIATKGTSPQVSMNLKGAGYSTDQTNYGSSSLSLRFTGVRSGYQIVGTLNGTIVSGVKSINNGKPIVVKNVAGHIPSVSFYPFNVGGAAYYHVNKIYSSGTMCNGQYPFTSSGTLDLKRETFGATLKGAAYGRGSQMNLIGTTQVVTNGTHWNGTNYVPTLVIIPDEVLATGKIAGQKITATGYGELWD